MARLSWQHPFWEGKKKPFTRFLIIAALAIILLFLIDLSYLCGSLFRDSTRLHNLNLLAVDYDGGVLGEAMQQGYEFLQSDSYPTFHFYGADKFPTIQDAQDAVCRGDYWGAVVVESGASDRLAAALAGGSAADAYNSSETLTYITNGIYYPSVHGGSVVGSITTLGQATTKTYWQLNATYDVENANLTDPDALTAFLNPITLTQINIMPTNQGDDVFYNTLAIVMVIIQQIIGAAIFNALCNKFGIYKMATFKRIAGTAETFFVLYTLIASLCTTGYIWAFRESWGVSGLQFFQTWMTFWLFMHVNAAICYGVITWAPPAVLPFFILTWMIFNVTSTFYPFELQPAFYSWGYALPAKEAITILWSVWSGGCNNEIHRALPILIAWDICAHAFIVWGFYRRNKKALQAQNQVDIRVKEDGAEANELHPIDYEHSPAPSAMRRGMTESCENVSETMPKRETV